jgi:glutaredoxin
MFTGATRDTTRLESAPSPDQQRDLLLYMYTGCGYSYRVMRKAQQLGIELPIVDIHADADALRTLLDATGRRTVPCLFIDGEPLHESLVIMEWLDQYAKRST